MWSSIKKYGAIAATSALADAAYTAYILSATRDWILLSLFLGSSIPFLNMLSTMYFVESADRKEQFRITCAISAGMFVGSLVTLLWMKP